MEECMDYTMQQRIHQVTKAHDSCPVHNITSLSSHPRELALYHCEISHLGPSITFLSLPKVP